MPNQRHTYEEIAAFLRSDECRVIVPNKDPLCIVGASLSKADHNSVTEEMARKHGQEYFTIEQTSGMKGLRDLIDNRSNLSKLEEAYLLNEIARKWARTVAGEVKVLTGNTTPDYVFNEIVLPELLYNTNVPTINGFSKPDFRQVYHRSIVESYDFKITPQVTQAVAQQKPHEELKALREELLAEHSRLTHEIDAGFERKEPISYKEAFAREIDRMDQVRQAETRSDQLDLLRRQQVISERREYLRKQRGWLDKLSYVPPISLLLYIREIGERRAIQREEKTNKHIEEQLKSHARRPYSAEEINAAQKRAEIAHSGQIRVLPRLREVNEQLRQLEPHVQKTLKEQVELVRRSIEHDGPPDLRSKSAPTPTLERQGGRIRR